MVQMITLILPYELGSFTIQRILLLFDVFSEFFIVFFLIFEIRLVKNNSNQLIIDGKFSQNIKIFNKKISHEILKIQRFNKFQIDDFQQKRMFDEYFYCKPQMKQQKSDSYLQSTAVFDSVMRQNKECRICLQDLAENTQEIIAPCKCSGSVKYVHNHCLKQWIETSLRKKISSQIEFLESEGIPCELCKQKINFELQNVFGCRSCHDMVFKAKYNLKKFVFLVFALFTFFVSSIVCFIISGQFEYGSRMFLMIICFSAFLGLSGAILLVFLLFQYAIYQDLQVKSILQKQDNRLRLLKMAKNNQKREKDMRIYVLNID